MVLLFENLCDCKGTKKIGHVQIYVPFFILRRNSDVKDANEMRMTRSGAKAPCRGRNLRRDRIPNQ